MLDRCSVSCCETAFVRRLDFLIDVSVATFVKAKGRKKTLQRLNTAAPLLTKDNTNKAPNKIPFRVSRPLCVNVAFIAINVSFLALLFFRSCQPRQTAASVFPSGPSADQRIRTLKAPPAAPAQHTWFPIFPFRRQTV